MIISNLTGGLGNQMFQYAFGRFLSLKNKTELKYHFTNALFNTQRSFALDVFNIKATEIINKDLNRFGIIQNRLFNRVLYLLDDRYNIQLNKYIVTQHFPYTFDESLRNITNDRYVQGYFADERYFKGIENCIRNEFTPKKKLDEINQKILKHIQKTVSVSIHVRRGDFITNKANSQFVGIDYYITAIKKINKSIFNPVFFIFSDDISWCKENLTPLINRVQFINHNKGKNSYKDLVLMSNCKHNIIANSTFSWWGAWLNQNKNKIFIKP